MPETWAVAIISVLATSLIGAVAYIFTRSQAQSDRVAARGDGAVGTLAEVRARLDGHDREFRDLKQHQHECDGKLAELRRDVAERFTQEGARVGVLERRQGEYETTVNSALSRIDATLNNLKESMDRFIALENARTSQPKSGGLGEFTNLIEAMRLVGQLQGLQPQGGHA